MIVLNLFLAFGLFQAAPSRADEPGFDRKEDVIYGRKYGTALTLDVLTPKANAKGVGVIFMVSGGFVSSHEAIQPVFFKPFLDHGYTVFAVVHGCQPRFQVPEIIEDVNRAVRFIRHHAKDYKIDPDRLGVYGASAGGHLSLMLGTAGKAGDPSAKDPVDRESSRVQAVACFFPPTDWLNFGEPGKERLRATDFEPQFSAAFDYRKPDEKTGLWLPIDDPDTRREIARATSPITHVTPDDPPTLLIHGDADTLVSIQQSESFEKKLRETGVESRLIVKKGSGHGWVGLDKDLDTFVEWFDQHLAKPAAAKAAQAAPAGAVEKRPG
ncbi:alpha/beta hydrolase [Paludisphaera borealis]|nr:alpha/beta hydrolase [Paludisphaera borealis]